MNADAPTPLATLPTVLTVDELTHVLRVGEDKVRILVASGELRRLTYSQKRILVARREVFDFLARSTTAVPTDRKCGSDDGQPS
jgi:hypothetical protein